MHRLALLLAAALFATATSAQPIVVTLDPARTSIDFTLADVLHTVHGTFKLTSGHIELDPDKKTIFGKAIVDAASGNSGNGARDGRMKKNILEVAQYPEISFEPAILDGTTPGAPLSSVTVTGWLSIHGQRHRVTIPMQARISETQVSATGKFTVPYVAWGMKNPSTLFLRVSETVDIAITTAGTVSATAPAFH